MATKKYVFRGAHTVLSARQLTVFVIVRLMSVWKLRCQWWLSALTLSAIEHVCVYGMGFTIDNNRHCGGRALPIYRMRLPCTYISICAFETVVYWRLDYLSHRHIVYVYWNVWCSFQVQDRLVFLDMWNGLEMLGTTVARYSKRHTYMGKSNWRVVTDVRWYCELLNWSVLVANVPIYTGKGVNCIWTSIVLYVMIFTRVVCLNLNNII